MSLNTPKCHKVSCTYHFEYPSEDKIRTPGRFQEQIKRFGAKCKEANDEIKIIEECKDCTSPRCEEEIADADKKVLYQKELIAELERKIGKERKKEEPNEENIKGWEADIESHKASIEDAETDKAEWEESKAVCEKLKGEWKKELKSLRRLLDTLLREYAKGSPWECGAPTKDKPPHPCGYEANYVDGKWGYCPEHR